MCCPRRNGTWHNEKKTAGIHSKRFIMNSEGFIDRTGLPKNTPKVCCSQMGLKNT